MIRVERDPAFWTSVAAHPAVTPALLGVAPNIVGALAQSESVLPLASRHGGFFFVRQDALGFVRELHTLFTPEGWGREVLTAGKEALDLLFEGPCQIVTTYEMADNHQSQPPRSFGFKQAGDWSDTQLGQARSWFLTRDTWSASPASRRMH